MFLANFNTSDASRPSFFEMLAQQEMISVLRPAVTYVFDVKKNMNKLKTNMNECEKQT